MRLVTIIIASLCLAASSFGAIYETPKQFEPRKPDDVTRVDGSTVFLTWAGKTVVHVGGFYNGRCFMESFSYRDGHRMTNADINKFLKPYLAAGLSTGPITGDSQNDFLSLQDRNGKAPAMMHYALERNVLSVMTWDCWISVYPKEAAQRAALLKQKAPATPAPADEKNDCLIIATDAFARLKQTAAWARIAGFRFLDSGKDVGGHAVVFYQPTVTSNVFMYDKTLGSIDLEVQSHDLTVIIAALNDQIRKADLFQAGEPTKWLGEAGGLVSDSPPIVDQSTADADDDTPDRGLQPAREIDEDEKRFAAQNAPAKPAATATPAPTASPAASYSSAKQQKMINAETQKNIELFVGFLILAIAFSAYVTVVTICFMKGKQVFGVLSILALLFGGFSLWAIIGACRIAKPDSWWARKKYGLKKMDIAHRRFTPFYNQAQEAVPVIIDDPVERALERVRRKQAII